MSSTGEVPGPLKLKFSYNPFLMTGEEPGLRTACMYPGGGGIVGSGLVAQILPSPLASPSEKRG